MKLMNELFINVLIIISFVTIGNHLFRNRCTNQDSSHLTRVLTGALAGLLGCVLMLYSVTIMPQVVLDFRNIPIIMMAVYAPFSSVMVTSLVIGLFRLTLFGINEVSIISFIVSVLMGIGCGLVGTLRIRRSLKWVLNDVITIMLASSAFMLLISESSILTKVLISFYIGTFIVSCLMYYLLEYLTLSNRLFHIMEDELRKDYLTGLYNARQFEHLLKTAAKHIQERDQSLSLLYMDIDHFKHVNDTYGHLAGDKVLMEIGSLIKQCCRSNDIISRNGGEEFTTILTDCPLEKAAEIAERIRKTVESHKFAISDCKSINITLSIGISSFPHTCLHLGKVLEQSDSALYRAKNEGRNRVVIANLTDQ